MRQCRAGDTRAYAQYVAERSRSQPLKTQLKAALNQPGEEFRQWETDDFAPIAQAIDNLFQKLRWL